MVRSSSMENKVLVGYAGDPKARDFYIMDALGVRHTHLDKIRGTEDLTSRIVDATRLLGECGDAEDITYINIAALMFPKWDQPRALAASVSKLATSAYLSVKEERKAEYGIDVPIIQCLREEVIGYQGNLYEALRKWPGIKPSCTDWSKSVRLPLEVSAEVAYTLGVVWADGSIAGSGKHRRLQMIGSEKDVGFYKTQVAPSLYSVFNVESPITLPKEGQGPQMRVHSFAVTSWLLNHMGFPWPKKRVKLPPLDWRPDQRSSFFAGVLSGMGNLRTTNGSRIGQLIVSEKDQSFIKEIEALARIEGFDPRTSTNGRSDELLRFTTDQITAMNKRGLLRNPAWDVVLSNR